jgi:hypothetical protein
MSQNGISTLATKQLRQEAKLALAASKRATDPERYPNATPDLDLLPTKYSGNDIIDNPNTGGLQLGRPWIT